MQDINNGGNALSNANLKKWHPNAGQYTEPIDSSIAKIAKYGQES